MQQPVEACGKPNTVKTIGCEIRRLFMLLQSVMPTSPLLRSLTHLVMVDLVAILAWS